ncbi:hypothetical protein [Flavicella sp.]|uniref:hypothetical protein n=1 Tax=Flavicella sp. TaxID=2957742 RepID=UPI00301AB353
MKKGISKLFFKNKSKKKKHILLVFLLCSTLFWFLTKLSKEYETTVVYNVNYEDLPSLKLFQNSPENKVEIYVKASGFNLLSEQFKTKKINIGLRNVVSKGKYEYYLLLKSKENQIRNQLDNSVKLIRFVKDTLFFELGFNKHKKVPVIPNLDFRFKLGYNLSNKVFLIPDSIEISGPEAQVDKINSIASSFLMLEDILEDVLIEIPIVKPEGVDKLNFDVENITVVAEVEKFTENSFSVPFDIIGLPKGTMITTYPNSVKVVFQVGISNYKKISANDFKVVCTYQKSEIEDANFLIPKLVIKPSLVSSIKIIPNRIEYLIQK